MYLALGALGLQILDISNPTSPSLVGNYNPSGDFLKIKISGNYAYVVDLADFVSANIQILDISNPTSPSLVGSYDGFFLNIFLLDEYMYGAGFMSGKLEIIDISDPTSPSLAGSYVSPNEASGVNSMYVRGNYVYLICSSGASQESDGFQVVDISDPTSPSLVGSYGFLGTNIHVIDNYAYVITGSLGELKIIDISNPNSPSLVAFYDTLGFQYNLDVDSGFTYIANGSAGLKIIDIRLYSTTSPYITPTTPQTFSSSLISFTETLGTNNEGSLTYQVSATNGVTWSYWNGSAWATTVATDGTETNTVSDINTNITTFDTDGGEFSWRAYLNSDGTQQVELDEIVVNYNTQPTVTSYAGVFETSLSVVENSTGTLATVTATDSDTPSQTLTYALGWTDGSLFSIDSVTGEVSFTNSPDYELPLDANEDNIYNIVVTVSDGIVESAQFINVTVTDTNEEPVITSNSGTDVSVSIVENTIGTLVDVNATDVDLPAQTLTYSVTGDDSALFSINSETGILTFTNSPDYELPIDTDENNIYDVTVQVSDSELTDSQNVYVTVANISEGSSGKINTGSSQKVCKDPKASNYEEKGLHTKALCKYGPTVLIDDPTNPETPQEETKEQLRNVQREALRSLIKMLLERLNQMIEDILKGQQ